MPLSRSFQCRRGPIGPVGAWAEPARYVPPWVYGSSPTAKAWVLPGLFAAYGSGVPGWAPCPYPPPSPKYSGSSP